MRCLPVVVGWMVTALVKLVAGVPSPSAISHAMRDVLLRDVNLITDAVLLFSLPYIATIDHCIGALESYINDCKNTA